MADAAQTPQVRASRPPLEEASAGPRPLLRLLRYVRGHPVPALLTVLFGTAGFLLSFVYPWIVGSVVDLIQNTQALELPVREQHLLRLTQLGALTGVGHALVVYGRGHFNAKLGTSVAVSASSAP